MGASLAEQLQAALAASQARANKGTPERAALDILTGQIDILVDQLKKTEAKPEAQTPVPMGDSTSGWRGSLPPGHVLVPSNLNPYTWWLRRCKVGDVFMVSTTGRSAGYQSSFYTAATEAGKNVRIERVVFLRGTTLVPVAETAIHITCIEPNENAQPVHDSGSAAGRKS